MFLHISFFIISPFSFFWSTFREFFYLPLCVPLPSPPRYTYPCTQFARFTHILGFTGSYYILFFISVIAFICKISVDPFTTLLHCFNGLLTLAHIFPSTFPCLLNWFLLCQKLKIFSALGVWSSESQHGAPGYFYHESICSNFSHAQFYVGSILHENCIFLSTWHMMWILASRTSKDQLEVMGFSPNCHPRLRPREQAFLKRPFFSFCPVYPQTGHSPGVPDVIAPRHGEGGCRAPFSPRRSPRLRPGPSLLRVTWVRWHWQ